MLKEAIAIVVGTRPEAIKMAPVFRELQCSETLKPLLISTGQHREMLSQALRVFGLVPNIDLSLMRDAQTLANLTSRAIDSLANCFEQIKPSAVLVQGDTTSVLSAAMAAFYLNIPIGHVEAGLRTGNMNSPWPEEMNRRLVAPLCTWCFAPTSVSYQNLIKEQIQSERCFLTGNTVVDALLWAVSLVDQRGESDSTICRRIGVNDRFVQSHMPSAPGRFILVTGHRRESFGDGIRSICYALRELVELEKQVGVLFPCHLNPNVRAPVMEILGEHPRISLIDPVDYLDMIWLIKSCSFIISDSGGIQEEAPTLGKPVLVTRDTTERPEGVDAGTSTLVGSSRELILEQSLRLLHDHEELDRRSRISNPYGDGTASQSIRGILESYFAK